MAASSVEGCTNVNPEVPPDTGLKSRHAWLSKYCRVSKPKTLWSSGRFAHQEPALGPLLPWGLPIQGTACRDCVRLLSRPSSEL